MTLTTDFQKRRIIATLGERDAVASFDVEGLLTVKNDNVEIVSKIDHRPATVEEVATIFGAGHSAQLDNIGMLTARMAEQKAESDATILERNTTIFGLRSELSECAQALAIANAQNADLQTALDATKAELVAALQAVQQPAGQA